MRSMIDVAISNDMQQRIGFARSWRIVENSDGSSGIDREPFQFGIKDAKADEPAEVSIDGVIGDPFDKADLHSVRSFIRDNRDRDLRVLINSMGGMAYEGIAIHNALLEHSRKVTTVIQSMAGSAASVIAVAGSHVQIVENAQFFIHRAALLVMGNRDVTSDATEWLDKVDDAIARTYKAKTNRAYDKIMEQMIGKGSRDGTLFTAREALDAKFVDEIIPLRRHSQRAHIDSQPASQTRSDEALRASRIRVQRGVEWTTSRVLSAASVE